VPGGELSLPGPALLQLLQAVLGQGRAFRFQATGSSMVPFIRNGDVIQVAPISGATPRLGQVVACLPPGMRGPVVHRVIARRGSLWLTKGDNACRADGLLARPQLLGVVTRVERNGGPVPAGLGPERILIAWLSRRGALWSRLGPALRPAWKAVRAIAKR
jgi:hypothetical protein